MRLRRDFACAFRQTLGHATKPIMAVSVGTSLLLSAMTGQSIAQIRSVNGVYALQSNPGQQIAVEAVPVNNGEVITVIAAGTEISAMRTNSNAPYMFNEAGCVVLLTPGTSNNAASLTVTSAGNCTGKNANLAQVSGTYVRQNQTEAARTPSAAPSNPGSSGPSFNCAAARTAAEVTVCQSAALSHLDREVEESFRKTLQSFPAGERQQIRVGQRHWIASRDQCGTETRCLTRIYAQRLNELNQSDRSASQQNDPPQARGMPPQVQAIIGQVQRQMQQAPGDGPNMLGNMFSNLRPDRRRHPAQRDPNDAADPNDQRRYGAPPSTENVYSNVRPDRRELSTQETNLPRDVVVAPSNAPAATSSPPPRDVAVAPPSPPVATVPSPPPPSSSSATTAGPGAPPMHSSMTSAAQAPESQVARKPSVTDSPPSLPLNTERMATANPAIPPASAPGTADASRRTPTTRTLPTNPAAQEASPPSSSTASSPPPVTGLLQPSLPAKQPIADAGTRVATTPPVQTQTYLVPRNAVLGFAVGQGIGAAMRYAMAFAGAKQDLSTQIAQARRRFWAAYPDGSDRESAEEEFSKLLFVKDYAYMAFYIPQGPYSAAARFAAQHGGEMDGGILETARPTFNQWIETVREALGAKNHIPDAMKGIRQPDIAMFTPDRFLSILNQPAIQEGYDEYKVRRDRAEFAAVGRVKEFDAMREKMEGEITVSAPTVTPDTYRWGRDNDWKGFTVAYGKVPSSFVPTIEIPLSDDVKFIWYKMTKSAPAALNEMNLWGYFSLAYVKRQDVLAALSGPNGKIVREDMNAIRAEAGVALLECIYGGNTRGTARSDYYWFKKRPTAADPSALRSRLPNHPILIIGEPRESCPANASS